MKMRRFAVGVGLAVVVFLACFAVIVNYNLKLHQSELQQLRQENQELNTKLDATVYENSRLQALFVDQEETLESLAPSADLVSQLEEGFAQRIRDFFSDSSMEVLGIYPVGEDTQESIRRFYLCNGSPAEFYLVDYITGEIRDLSSRASVVYIVRLGSGFSEGSKVVWSNKDVKWEFRAEDYDGDGEEDILLVTPFFKANSGGIMLWLQRQGDFLPVNSCYCGNYTGWRESKFSLLIEEKEKQFRNEQDQEAWSADNVGAWIREELFAGRAEELEEELQNPKDLIPYTQLREPLDIHVTLAEDEQGRYRVKIPENPYGEKRINEWLRKFYEEEDEYQKSVMGEGIEDDNGLYLSERERQELGFYYSYDLLPERVDDVMICLISDAYEYAGGVHGNSYMHAVNFDTQSGGSLELQDVIYDTDSFCKFATSYIFQNYMVYSWDQPRVRAAVMNDGWCFTDYGFRVFLVGINGAGYNWYEIPYELLVDYVKEEYLPVSRAAEYEMPYGIQESVQMDVNGDGLLDVVSFVREEEDIFWAINGEMTKLELQWQGIRLKELDIDTRTLRVWLERQEDGVTRLFWEVDFYGSGWDKYTVPKDRVYVYRIEGETFVYERDY